MGGDLRRYDLRVVTDGMEARQRPQEPPPGGPPAIVLAQYRVFSRDNGARLKSKVSAEFFRRLLAGRGFEVEAPARGSSFTARRQ